MILTGIILVFIVFAFILTVYVFVKQRQGRVFAENELKYIESHWIRIIDSFSEHTENAIMDADKLLDYALSRKGFEGTLGEKLKKAGAKFSDLNGVWQAHKLRNRIAHELVDIDKSEAKSALRQFKRALNDLGAKL